MSVAVIAVLIILASSGALGVVAVREVRTVRAAQDTAKLQRRRATRMMECVDPTLWESGEVD